MSPPADQLPGVIVAIPLSTAYLCVNCEYIVPVQTSCPVCTGTHFLNLARILDRKETPDANG